MRKLLYLAALSLFASPAFAQQAPNATPVPLQWNVTIPTATNVTTATYPGNVTVTGTLTSGAQVLTAPEQLPIYTVATLPTCNAAAKGQQAAVSDATAPTYNGALTGGGAVSVPVFCNGSAWTSH